MQVYWKTKRYTKSQDIAAKPNEHFSLVNSDSFKESDSKTLDTGLSELKRFLDGKVSNDIYFRTHAITL